MEVSEAGIHRPHVAGIHGRDNDGAYSIVLSGGYEDDQVCLLLLSPCRQLCLGDKTEDFVYCIIYNNCIPLHVH